MRPGAGEFGDDPNRYTDARKLMRLIIPHVITSVITSSSTCRHPRFVRCQAAAGMRCAQAVCSL